MPKRQSKRLPTAELLPSGAYRCRVLVNGKRESFTASTASEAQEMALLAKIGMPQKKYSKRTVGQAIDDYIKSREAVLSPSTIRGYKIIRKNRMQSVMDRTIDSTNQIAWQQAINDEAKAGINAKYIRNIWGLIRPALEMETGSAPSVRLPQRIKNPRPFLDDREVKIFLDAIRGDTAELASLFALHSLRRSEIMALTWDDIDLKNKTISVNGAMVIGEGNKKVLKKETKTDSSRRTIPIIIPRLFDLLDSMEPNTGTIVNIKNETLYKHINSICKKNGLSQVGIHGLRHTFASIGFYLGIPPKALQEMGGWSDQRVMMDIYTHISSRQKNQYIEKFQGFFE